MKVQSSAIAELDYDGEQQTLTVKFHSGQTHRYEGVPSHVFETIANSSSLGRTFHSLVRDKYPSSKL